MVKNTNCHNHGMLSSLSCDHIRQGAVIIVMWPLRQGLMEETVWLRLIMTVVSHLGSTSEPVQLCWKLL